jgi:hypothetical protein
MRQVHVASALRTAFAKWSAMRTLQIAFAMMAMGGWVQAETLTLGNGKVLLSYEASSHRLTMKTGEHVAMAVPCAPIIAAETSQEVRNSVLHVKSAGGEQQFWLDGPWLLTKVTLSNTGTAPMVIDKIITFAATIDPQKPVANTNSGKIIGLGADGPWPLKPGRVSYAFLADVDPSTRAGIVSGWLSHERASGIVLSRFEILTPKIEARAEFGRLIIAPGQSAEGDTFAMGFFDDAIAKANDIHLPRPMCGYSTWYHAHALDQDRMAQWR